MCMVYLEFFSEIRLDLAYTSVYYQSALDAVLLAGKQPASELQKKLLSAKLKINEISADNSPEEKLSHQDEKIDNMFATLPVSFR